MWIWWIKLKLVIRKLGWGKTCSQQLSSTRVTQVGRQNDKMPQILTVVSGRRGTF